MYLTACVVAFALLGASGATPSKTRQKSKTEIQKAIDWLMLQRLPNYGWGTGLDTAQALLAVELTKSSINLERKLSAKQLEIDLILNLWHHDDPDAVPVETERLTIGNIAVYCLALIAACHDPRLFHGHDLIGSLYHHEAYSDLEFAMSSLATCKAGIHVRKRHLRRLTEITNNNQHVEVLSKSILALQCAERDHRHRNVKALLKKPLASLASLQQDDGGFGSIHATAVAMQALQEGKTIWNRTSAVIWLLEHQGPDGAFYDIPTTGEAIVALANSATTEGCDERPIHDDDTRAAIITPYAVNGTEQHMLVNESAEVEETTAHSTTVTVTYSLWLGSNVSEMETTNVTVARNVTFYDVMVMAAAKDEKYQFSATEWPNGHYVHTLYGHKEEPLSYHYWMLYKLSEFPDKKNPPGNQLVAPTGVDDLIVQDGEHYLFWYKKL